jgi:tripartite-type tricarboxylate transporter receptor subunit TctC
MGNLLIYSAAGAAALSGVSRIARAQAYPTRPVRMVAPFAAGGAEMSMYPSSSSALLH